MLGNTISHYEITEKLGQGGMGEVHRARDTKLARDVALKILPDAFAHDTDRIARFTREAQTLAALNHPNIAQIYGIIETPELQEGEAGGVHMHALVMELVEGEDLAQRLSRGPVPLLEALPLVQQIAKALEAAHEADIVHRDLKPANIMVRADGTLKVLDFGLARAVDPAGVSGEKDLMNSPTLSIPVTQIGTLLGTAAYMSPEQACGRGVDRRADIWAFGAVFFEMLVGKPLYEGRTTSEILAQVIEREPDLSRLPAGTPPWVRQLIRRCLTKNAQKRLRDIGDARIAVEEQLANPAALEAEEDAAIPTARQKWPVLLLWLFGGLAIGALVTGITLWYLGPPGPLQATMRFSAVTNFTGIDAEPSFSPDGRSVTFLSNRGGSFDIWVSLVAGGSPVRITNDSSFKARPHWSPDGSKISYIQLNESGLWDVWVVPALGGTPRKLLNNANDSAWSPDGRSLTYADFSTRTIWVCDATGSNARQLTQSEDTAWHLQPAYSHDGTKIAFVRRTNGPRGELASVDVATGRVERITGDGALAVSPVWSADNQYVYFASSRGGSINLWKVAARGGSPVQITAGRGDDSYLDVSADGRKIVFESQRSVKNLLEAEVDSATEAGRRWLTTDAARGTLAPVYSPDGRRIAYFTYRNGAENESIWMMNADGSNPVQLVADTLLNIFPRWTLDGQSLIFTSRRPDNRAYQILRRLNLSDAVPAELPVEPGDSTWGDVGLEGRLVFRGKNGQVQIFDPRENKTESLNTIRGGFLHWAPDGRHISSVVSARYPYDKEAGVWVYDSRGGAAHHVFDGWVVYHAWSGADEIFVVEGRPDLSAILWRVFLDGTPAVRTRAILRLNFALVDVGSPLAGSPLRFDVHPDRRHIVMEAFRFQESDISMIENMR